MKKRVFTKKHEVTRLIRDEFRDNPEIKTDDDAAVSFLNRVMETYDVPAATLCFFMQKINMFRLFEDYRTASGKQVYPKAVLIDIRELGKRFGYTDLIKTVKTEIARKIALAKTLPKKAHLSVSEYGTIKKAAEKNKDIARTLEMDKTKEDLSKFADSKMLYDFKELVSYYSENTGLETYIKKAFMDSDVIGKKVLDEIRKRKFMTFNKNATLESFMHFKEMFDTFKEASINWGLLNDNSSSKDNQ